MLADTRRASHQTGAMSRCAIVLLALSTLSQAAGADAQGPGVRTSHVLVYHEGLQRVVMITGSRVDTTETIWAWDGAAWTPAAVDGPPARGLGAAAFDSTRGVLVLHGGAPGRVSLGDTWEWDGTRWSLRDARHLRDHHAMTFDRAAARTARRTSTISGSGTARNGPRCRRHRHRPARVLARPWRSTRRAGCSCCTAASRMAASSATPGNGRPARGRCGLLLQILDLPFGPQTTGRIDDQLSAKSWLSEVRKHCEAPRSIPAEPAA